MPLTLHFNEDMSALARVLPNGAFAPGTRTFVPGDRLPDRYLCVLGVCAMKREPYGSRCRMVALRNSIIAAYGIKGYNQCGATHTPYKEVTDVPVS